MDDVFVYNTDHLVGASMVERPISCSRNSFAQLIESIV